MEAWHTVATEYGHELRSYWNREGHPSYYDYDPVDGSAEFVGRFADEQDALDEWRMDVFEEVS